MTRCLELALPAIPVNIRKLRDEVAEIAARSGANERVVEDVRLCVSEAVTNVVRHAYEPDRGDVGVSVELVDGELTVAVHDEGHGLSEFRREGELGYGLRIIDALTLRSSVSSAPTAGTEVVMVFGLQTLPRVLVAAQLSGS